MRVQKNIMNNSDVQEKMAELHVHQFYINAYFKVMEMCTTCLNQKIEIESYIEGEIAHLKSELAHYKCEKSSAEVTIGRLTEQIQTQQEEYLYHIPGLLSFVW